MESVGKMNPSIPWEDVQTLNVDFDHTITNGKSDEYLPISQQSPNRELIDKMWEAYKQRKTIIVWTARPWSDASEIAGTLTVWEVPFHGLMMGKGGSDQYVDDKAMRPDEFVSQSLVEPDQKQLDEM